MQRNPVRKPDKPHEALGSHDPSRIIGAGSDRLHLVVDPGGTYTARIHEADAPMRGPEARVLDEYRSPR